MGRKITGPQDINVRKLIRSLENTKVSIWKTIAASLKKARRARAEINVGDINRIVNDGDVIAVPGKVLSSGVLERKVTIGALGWSEAAMEKINASGSTIVTLDRLASDNPAGSNVRIVT